METFNCVVCKTEKPVQTDGGTGYANRNDGTKVCYVCCAEEDKAYMVKHGKNTLYLTKKDDGKYYVSNWPGTLAFPVSYQKKGKHNIAGTRADVWFTGPDGKNWHGVQYGEWSEICRVKRIA